jgi:hypothetical protein
MIDNFSLALSHGLIILAAWRLVFRRDLDDPTTPPPASPEPRARWTHQKGAPRA